MEGTTATAGEVKTVDVKSTPAEVSVQSQSKESPIPSNGKDAAQPTSAEVEKAIKKFKLNVLGEESEFDLDNPEHIETVKKLAQKGMGADKKFNEAALMRKQNEEFIKLLKSNPEAVLSHPSIGVDVLKWAEDFIYQRLAEKNLSPEEREKLEMKRKLQTYEEQEKKTKQEAEWKQYEAEVKQNRVEIEKKIVGALDKSGLPKTPWTVMRMAHYLYEGERQGVHFEPEEITDLVQEEYKQDLERFYDSLPAEKLLSMVSEGFRKKLRDAEIAVVKQPAPKVPSGEQPPANSDEAKPSKKMTIQEWRERNQKLFAGE